MHLEVWATDLRAARMCKQMSAWISVQAAAQHVNLEKQKVCTQHTCGSQMLVWICVQAAAQHVHLEAWTKDLETQAETLTQRSHALAAKEAACQEQEAR